MAKTSKVVKEIEQFCVNTRKLTQFKLEDLPQPNGPDATVGEWVSPDVSNPFEVIVNAVGDEAATMVRFTLTQLLTDQQVEKAAPDVLRVAAGVDGNLSMAHNRLVLSYGSRSPYKTSGEGIANLGNDIDRGTQYAKGLRQILEKTFNFPTDAATENWYKYKLGVPVKLSAQEMQAMQGGAPFGSTLSLGATVLGALIPGVVGSLIVGTISGGAEAVDELAPMVTNSSPAPRRPSGPSGPYKAYCFARSTAILTQRGQVAIADVCAGDQISYRDENGVEQTTLALGIDHHTGTFEMVEVVTTQGSFVVTADHPFFHEGQWVQAAALKHIDRSGSIVSVRTAPAASEVFNVRTVSGLYAVDKLLVSGRVAALARAA